MGADMCGGTIVDSNWIVTAAHCFDRFVQTFNYLFLFTHSILNTNPTPGVAIAIYIYIYIYIYIGTLLISILKKILIFVQKINSRSSEYFCLFWPIGTLTFALRFWDTLLTTIFELPRKIWRIKIQNNSRNIFSPRLFKNTIFSQLNS